MTNHRVLNPASGRRHQIPLGEPFPFLIVGLPPITVLASGSAVAFLSGGGTGILTHVIVVTAVTLAVSLAAGIGLVADLHRFVEMRPDTDPDLIARKLRPAIFQALRRISPERWPVRVIIFPDPDIVYVVTRDHLFVAFTEDPGERDCWLPVQEAPTAEEVDALIRLRRELRMRMRPRSRIRGGIAGMYVAAVGRFLRGGPRPRRECVEEFRTLYNFFSFEASQTDIAFDRPSCHEMANTIRSRPTGSS